MTGFGYNVNGFGVGGGLFIADPGQEVFLNTVGAANTDVTHTWTCPDGVYSISIVCVGGCAGHGNHYNFGSGVDTFWGAGGGGLAYVNNFSVTPGTDYTVVVGGHGVSTGVSHGTDGEDTSFNGTTCKAGGGGGGRVYGHGSGAGVGAGGTVMNGTGGAGGAGGGSAQSALTSIGGGGAGGYSGAGGAGMGGSGSGGGGAGGNPGGGGGVGLLGEGSSGSSDSDGGDGGSGGGDATNAPGSTGGAYGGAGGTTGGKGAVRLMWPGDERSYPSTRVADE